MKDKEWSGSSKDQKEILLMLFIFPQKCNYSTA